VAPSIRFALGKSLSDRADLLSQRLGLLSVLRLLAPGPGIDPRGNLDEIGNKTTDDVAQIV
jgi:hypothetical protein